MPATTTLFPRPTAAKPALQELGEERRESARIRDVLLAMAGDEPAQAYLVEPDEASFTQGDRPEVLFAHWFDTEAPNGDRREFLEEALLAHRGGPPGSPERDAGRRSHRAPAGP